MALNKTTYVGKVTKIMAKNLNDIQDEIIANGNNVASAKSEVEDIRIGADGTTYATAGDAVRGQFSRLNNTVESLTAIDINYLSGIITAIGGMDSAGRGATSNKVVQNVFGFTIKEGARAVIGLYKDEAYLGKINSHGTLDQVSGDWYSFTAGTHSIAEYLNTYDADGIMISVIPTDGSTITDVQTYGDTHLTIYSTDKYALKSEADKVQEMLPTEPTITEWIMGEYIKNTDGTIGTHTQYHRTDYLDIDPTMPVVLTTTNAGNYSEFYNAWYDETKTFIQNFSYARDGSIIILPPANARYCRLSCNATVNLSISAVASLKNLPINSLDLTYQARIRNATILHKAHSGSGTYIYNATRNSMDRPLYTAYDLIIRTDANHDIAYQLFDGYEIGLSHMQYASGWLTSFDIPAGSYFCMCIRNSDNSVTDMNTNNSIWCDDAMPINEQIATVFKELSKELPSDTGNYLITSALSKENIKVSDALGTLTYAQSFCIYNEKYYSINGANIAVQNSDFSSVSTSALNTGHGNALQLGHNGKAYASGWNDQKVYVVDLETLTVTDTITLPTTGYTTCAVDDINQIVYIFQRDSYPDTEAVYNFIAYDYANAQTLYTRKTRPFAAMQACDIYNGSIIVLNGLGTTTAPNYYLVYNTSGDVVGEYILPQFANTEPEGVCFNRDTYELVISTISKDVYKITL